MDDYISRQDAIDALRKKQDNGKGDISRFYNTIIQHDIEAIMALPSSLGMNLAEVGRDCISRQAAIDALRNYLLGKNVPCDGTLTCRLIENEVINKLPSAQPKRGKWIYHIDDLFPAESTMECNQCRAEQPLTCDDEFCPHCGAKMEGADDE